jgi:Skp family chaperone for outer membrane proteins
MPRWIASLALLSLAAPAQAADALRVGYVDMQGALAKLGEAQREQQKLKKEFEEKQKKLDRMQEEAKKLKDDYEKQGAMLKDEAKQRRQSELQQKLAELQQTYMTLQKEMTEKQQTVTRDIFGKMKAIVEKIGDRDGYQLILDRSDALVLYFKRHTDVTDEVVQTYNGLYK